ncbi:MAG: DUF1926 domain-containing protein [Treponema sp.]|nr:DUF1926 domain-containing protein [Treponema sp.]
MAEVNICLELSVHGYLSSPAATMEDDYQSILKPFFSFLYSNSSFPFSFSFSSALLAFLERKHPESLEILKELYARRQVEFLGCAYHDPMLPLIFPIDRSAQVEKMNSLMRSLLGKRPRGMVLPGSIWDYSLVTSLNSCGMEFLELDSTLVPSSSRYFYPLITGGMGKSVKVLCTHSDLLPDLSKESPAAWLVRIQKAVTRSLKNDESPLVNLSFDLPSFKTFFSSPFFAYVSACVQNPGDIHYQGFRFTLPQLYLKGARVFIPTYIPAGMDWTLARWSRKPFESCENKSRFPLTVYDYLNCYADSRSLYDRMMYISMVLSQGHGGDKVQKNLAKEKLWEAQCIANYVSLPSGVPASSERRQEAFRLLNEAEMLMRQSQDVKKGRKADEQKASVISYDYNRDGVNEYICSLKKLRLVISRVGGQIVELDNIAKGCNYAASLSRVAAFDGVEDGYGRGFFIDHFLPPDGIASYERSLDAGTSVFSRLLFDEKKLDMKRNEILFSSKGSIPSSSAPLALLKKYTVLDDGISIQYILKNEGTEPVRGTFVVESNFAQTCFAKNAEAQYTCEMVLDGNTQLLGGAAPFNSPSGVSALRITDGKDRLQFNFEPNEEAGFISDTISFKRPDAYGFIREDSKTLIAALFWEIDLPAGRSVEKNINFSVTGVPNRKRSPAASSAAL